MNADIQARVKPDWLLDITKVNWGDVLKTRKGLLTIERGMFDVILANDILEHLPDLVTAMTKCKE